MASARIQPPRCFPYCVVWTPIPVVTWLLPFVGHMGICLSGGKVLDFAGPYYVGDDGVMAFGHPTRYLALDPRRCEAPDRDDSQLGEWWDGVIEASARVYRERMYNFCCDNCHQFVAHALNSLVYAGSMRWDMVRLAAWVFVGARHVGVAGAAKSWLPFLLIMTAGGFFGGAVFFYCYLVFLALATFVFLLSAYALKPLFEQGLGLMEAIDMLLVPHGDKMIGPPIFSTNTAPDALVGGKRFGPISKVFGHAHAMIPLPAESTAAFVREMPSSWDKWMFRRPLACFRVSVCWRIKPHVNQKNERVRWSVEEAGGRASGAVLMCGHRAGVRTLQHCSDGLEDVDVVLSVDNDGVCCVWDCMTCVCLVQRSVPEFAGGAVRHVHPMGDGKVLVALDTSKQVVDGILSPHRGHTLAVLTLVSLEVVDSWKPSLRVPLFKGSLPAEPETRLGGDNYPCSTGHVEEDTNNHLLQQPKVLLWDQDGAAAVLAADDLGGWHYTRLGMPVLATAAGHFGPVTCLFEVVYFGPHNAADMTLENGIVEGKGGLPLLVSGGADGSVRFWSLDKTSLGSKVFAVHAHSGAVRQVVGAAAGANAPWCQCLATVGDDGTVALISLLTRQVVRLLSGHPFQLPNQLMWDGIRGFIACLGTNSEGQQVLVIWDLYSGQRDRVFVGSQAKKMLECFAANVEDMAMTRQEHDWLQFQEGGCARVALAEHAPQDQLIKLLPGPKRDIGILDIDVTGILESPSGVSPAAWASGTVESWRRTVTVELLATALLCMHAWGVDRHVDDSLCALLGEMGLNQEGLKNGDLSTDPLATILGMSLTQGVMVSDTGAMTIQMPPTLACAVRRTKETAVNRGQDLSAAGIPVRAADLGHLWCNAAEFVGLQLLYAVALAKKLMHEGLNQVVATACSAIVKLYAIQFLDLAPAASVPSLGVLVGLWDTKNEILKDTARVLLASTTDPNRLMNSGEDGAPAQLTGRAEVDRVMTLWESCKSSGEWKDALAYAQEVVICGALCCVHSRLVPWPILQATAPLLAVLVCEPGHHYALMAASMLADALTGIEGPKWMNALGYTLPLIQSLLDVCDESHKKPKPSSHRLEKLGQSERPRSVRGDQPQEVGRMRRAKSESQLAPDEEGAATPHPTTPTPQLSSMPATTVPPSPFVTLQEFHSETGRTNETIPDDDASSSHSSKIEWASKPSHSLKITAKQIDGSARSQPRSPVSRSPRSRSPRSRSPLSRSPFSGETPNRKLRLHFQKASLSPFDFDGLAMEPWSPEELLYDVPVEEGLLPAYKEAVASVITALADLDLPLFLHCLGNRLVIDSMAGPQSLLTATGAISSVLRHRGGPKKAAPHLQLLTSVLMKALEPGQHSLRKSCYRGVTSLLAELCSLFPMLATNRAANRLALGNVVSTPLTPSRGKHKSDATRGLEAIAIYDLNTGHKKKCLSMGTALQQAAQHLKAAASGEEVTEDGTPGLGIAAVCFRQDGDVCAAYCPEATMLCVWDLRVSWGKKLSRGPTVIDPVKVVQLPPEVDVPRPGPGAQTDLAYRLSWQDANQVALHHGGRLLGVIELHLGS
eukprot:evm.model.scf_7.19 EVM.evm.TU.scf_7.19   scf_7:143388-159187(+)